MKFLLKTFLAVTAMLVIALGVGTASAEDTTIFEGDNRPAKGDTHIGVYFESSLFRDRSIGWSGSETSFQIRAKLDIVHTVYDDILFRAKGSFAPTVNDYTIGYDEIKEREANFEDTYARFSNVLGYSSDLRMGIVKVPFGIFDTMAFSDKNRPVSSSRTREWDYGVRYDVMHGNYGVSFAIINGDGREGTDANSAKSVAIRFIYSQIDGDLIYPETMEITRYPNPVVANPGGEFSWRVGLSAYAGNKYSTPIKVKNNHYGADIEFSHSVFTIKSQYSYLEGGFTDAEGAAGVDLSGYSSRVTTDIDTFAKGWAFVNELSVGVSKRTLVTVMLENYDPDSGSNDGIKQRTKTRIVAGVKHDFRPGVTAAFFYTLNDNPAFDDARNSNRGDDVVMAGVALQF